MSAELFVDISDDRNHGHAGTRSIFPNRSAPADSNRTRGPARAWLRGTRLRLVPAKRKKLVDMCDRLHVSAGSGMASRTGKILSAKSSRPAPDARVSRICATLARIRDHSRSAGLLTPNAPRFSTYV